VTGIPAPVNAARKVVDAARRWARSRAKYRQLLDSKSARKPDVERWRKSHVEDTHKLEKAVIELELAFRNYAKQTPKGQKRQFPWKEILGAVSNTASALEKAMDPVVQPQQVVIDVHGETVNAGTKH
jgi:hypothetical protein